MNNDYVHATQWAFNPSVYQNMANDEVDWATLAQQWIKMKEACPQMVTTMTVPPPPPPVIGPTSSVASNKDPNKEEGEAPMEMDNGKEDSENSVGAVSGDDQNWGQWGANWNQWSWGWGQVDPKMGSVSTSVEVPGYVPSTNAFTPAEVVPAPTQSYNQEYWTSNSEPYVRNKGDSWGSSSRRGSSRRRSRDRERKEEVENSEPLVLDAAKRKSLPAWIREGLEKMEREKQKQLEKEQLTQERQRLALENVNRETFQDSSDPVKLMKSKFDSDSESEENEEGDGVQRHEGVGIPKLKETSLTKYSRISSFNEPPPILKSKEEIMEETMLKVRRVLTQILMEVTTHEIEMVVNQVHSIIRKKAPATRNEKTPQMSSVTGKLGLGIYDSESDSSSENEEVPDKKDGEESDRELKERIMKKRKDFQKVEREIEIQIEQQEEKERRVLVQNDSDYSDSESDAGESMDTRHTFSKELEVRTKQQDTVNKGQVHPSNHSPDEASGEKTKTSGENHKNEVHESRVLSTKTQQVEKTRKRSVSEDSDSSSSSSDSSSSSSTSSSSESSSHKRSKSKWKSSSKDSKVRSRRKRSRSHRSRSYSRLSGKLSIESHTSSRSKRRTDRSSSRESRTKASSKKSRHSSERSNKRYQSDRRSRSDSWERKRHKSRSRSHDRYRKSQSPYSYKSSSRSHGHRSSRSRYSRSPSSKYSRSSTDKSRRDKSKRSRHSDSSPDSHSGDQKRRRR